MTAIKIPDHPYEQNELNNLDFCKCGVAKRLHTTDFIKQQQELAREFYEDELCCLSLDCEKQRQTIEAYNDLIHQVITNTGEELLRLAEGEKFREFEYEHTYPNEIGVDMGNGYEKRIEKGQTETRNHSFTEEEELHNEIINTLKKHITKLTGVE